MYVPRILVFLCEGPDWVTFSADGTAATKFIILTYTLTSKQSWDYTGLSRIADSIGGGNWTYIHVFLDALSFQSINNVTEVVHIVKSSQSLYNKFISIIIIVINSSERKVLLIKFINLPCLLDSLPWL